MRRPHGFTLVEIMIVLAISALILLTLFASLRTLSHAARATESVSTRVTDLQLVSTFLRKALINTRTLGTTATGQPEQPFKSFFLAQADRLRWVGLLDAHHGSGLYFMQISRSQVKGAQGSVLRFDSLPFNSEIFTGWPAGDPQILVEALDTLELAYQGNDPNSNWVANWSAENENLPARVRMRLKVNGRHWPELIYAFAP